MATDPELLSVLRASERSATPALVRFRDGDAYVVRIISTAHAEAGDNIVAAVLAPVSSAAGVPVPAGGFMDFLLGDVAEVEPDGSHVSAVAPAAEPGNVY